MPRDRELAHQVVMNDYFIENLKYGDKSKILFVKRIFFKHYWGN